MQVKEHNLIEAHNADFSVYRKDNNEIVVVFQPWLFCEYATRCEELHSFVGNAKDLLLLENLSKGPASVSNDVIGQASTENRATVLRMMRTRIRESNFSQRVLSAYDRQCAVCGVQLRLIDAAHIVPVAAEGSTDETSNGIALCALHHRAYDSGLIYFENDYRIVLNSTLVGVLQQDDLIGGLREFKSQLRPAISLPSDRRLRPTASNLEQGRKVRGT
jgi:putative restriction endonuclease